MLPDLRSALCLLLSFTSVVNARAISISSIPSGETFPSLNSNIDTIPDSKCDSLDGCRSLYRIVQSCIVTILACVWFAVHRNIPAPKVESPQYDNLFVKIYMYTRAEILDQRQAAAVFLVALLVPEWVLAWALRQFFVARQLSKELEEAREEAGQRRETKLSGRQEAEKETSESADDQVDSKPLAASTGTSTHTEHDQLLKRQVTPQDKVQSSQCERRCEECGLHSSSVSSDYIRKAVYDQVAAAQFVAKSNEGELGVGWIYPKLLNWTQRGK